MKTPISSATLAILLASVATPHPARAAPAGRQACSETTNAAYTACLHDALANFWTEKGKCSNELDAADRTECLAESRATLQDGRQECRAQSVARDDLCDDLGEAPYDPRFEPEDFVNPTAIGGSVAPNPLFPLLPGRTLVYRSPGETVRVAFTDQVKIIDGVPCMVVRDTVEVNGELEEDTLDWFAQDIHGNVWYCGEATAEYEDGFPARTDGSFQADVDGARPGLIMKAAPAVGDVYRQEFDLGNAEDAAKVVALDGSATTPAASCAGTCLVTEEFTPLSPDSLENKYYKAGVGLILQTKPDSDERLELVEIID